MEAGAAIANFQDPQLQSLWLEAFGNGAPLFRVGRPDTTLMLLQRRGWPVRTLCSPTNHFLPAYHCPAATGAEELDTLLRHARRQSSWDLVELDLIPESSQAYVCLKQLRERGWRMEMRPWQTTAVIDLAQPFDRYLASRSNGWRRQLRNNEKRLRRRGEVTVADEAPLSDWAARLEEAWALEAKGWKGDAGSAVLQSPTLCRYYTELFTLLRAHGQFRLFMLRVDGRLAAFNAMVTLGDVAYALKISYDPEMAESGPGNVLQVEMLRALMSEARLRKLDLQYPPSEWKSRWATGSENLLRVRIFADTLFGRSLYELRTLARRLRNLRPSADLSPSEA